MHDLKRDGSNSVSSRQDRRTLILKLQIQCLGVGHPVGHPWDIPWDNSLALVREIGFIVIVSSNPGLCSTDLDNNCLVCN